jgi:hypothetical protein
VENYILNVKREHSIWSARKIRERLLRRFSGIPIPAKSTIHAVLDRHGTGRAPRSRASACAGNSFIVYRQASRYLLTCEAISSLKGDYAFTVFERLLKERGLPAHIRSDNGVPFAFGPLLVQLEQSST